MEALGAAARGAGGSAGLIPRVPRLRGASFHLALASQIGTCSKALAEGFRLRVLVACNETPKRRLRRCENAFLKCFFAVKSFYTSSVSFEVPAFEL